MSVLGLHSTHFFFLTKRFDRQGSLICHRKLSFLTLNHLFILHKKAWSCLLWLNKHLPWLIWWNTVVLWWWMISCGALQILMSKKISLWNFNTLQNTTLSILLIWFSWECGISSSSANCHRCLHEICLSVDKICISFLSPFWWAYFVGKGYNSSYEVHFWPRETSTMVVFTSVREEKIYLRWKTFFWGEGMRIFT